MALALPLTHLYEEHAICGQNACVQDGRNLLPGQAGNDWPDCPGVLQQGLGLGDVGAGREQEAHGCDGGQAGGHQGQAGALGQAPGELLCAEHLRGMLAGMSASCARELCKLSMQLACRDTLTCAALHEPCFDVSQRWQTMLSLTSTARS